MEEKHNEFDVTLATGHTVGIFEYEGSLNIELINANGFCVSDIKLSSYEVEKIRNILSLIKN